MSPIRTAIGLFIATLGFVTGGCATSTDDATSASSTTSTDAELSVEPSASTASLTIAGDAGACTSFKALVDAHIAELEALCTAPQIALPSVLDREGCEKGSVKSVTFTCFDAKGPGRPGEGECRPMAIKDKKGALPEGCTDHAEDLEAVVCPHVDGMEPPPPPPPGADGGAPPPRPEGSADHPPPPPADGDAGRPPHGPRLQCCHPGGPRPPKGGGGGAPPAPSSSAEAPTQVQ